MTKLNRLLYVCVGVAWVGAGLGWVGAGLTIWDGNEAASTAVFGAVGGVMAATTFTAAVGWFVWKCRNLSLVVSDQFATGLPLRLTTLAQSLLNRLLCVCVGVAWAAASLVWVGAGLAIWDGAKAASTVVFVAVGAVMVAAFTTAVGWFAWKRRN